MMTEEAYSIHPRLTQTSVSLHADDTDSPNTVIIRGVNSVITQKSFYDNLVDPLRWVIVDNNGIAPENQIRLVDEIFWNDS